MDWFLFIQCESFDLYGSVLLAILGVWGTIIYAYHTSKGGSK